MGIRLTAKIKKANTRFSERITKDATIIMETAGRELAREFVDYITVYPPETDGNRPPYPYWRRGTGRIHRNGTVNPSSQKYGTSWNITNKKLIGGGETLAWTNVTYAPYLADPNKQTWFHAKNQWRTTDDALEYIGVSGRTVSDASPIIQNALNRVREIMGRVFNR